MTQENMTVADRLAFREQAKKDFIRSFTGLAVDAHLTAKEKGWWPSGQERNLPEMLLLMVTEIAEATEGLRAGNPPDDKIPTFSTLEAELADVIIRIMDMAGGLDLLVAEAVVEKLSFNMSRPHRHGDKKF